jgi:RNA polymerase sigma factor (sigma-70 family)
MMILSVEAGGPVAEVPLQPVGFEDFYRRASVEVFRTLVVVLRDADLAQEAMDEAMTRAFERWSRVGHYENPAGWVYRVALNWARSRLRKRSREKLADPEPALRSDPMPDPELDAAVARLPLHHREVVVFRFLRDMTQEQISELLDIPVGTVKSRLHRALETLRKEVGERA